MKNERPIFDLKDAASISDKEFAAMLDSNTQFVGNLSHFASANPDRWKAIRAERKKVGESPEQRAERHRRESVYHQPESPLTQQQIEARQVFDEQKCREMFQGTGAAKLKEVDPASYSKLQIAAKSFGVIAEKTSVHVSDRARGNQPKIESPTPEPKAEKTPLEGAHSVHEWVDHFERLTKAK